MGYSWKELIADMTFGYGLSGERRQASYKNWRRNVVAGILLLPLFVIISISVSNKESGALIYYGVGYFMCVVLAVYAYRRRDTGWQLWFQERHTIKQRREQHLQELMSHAEQVKKADRHAN